jgi:hypothetical protein
MTGSGDYAQMLGQRFELACRRLGLNREELALDCRSFRASARVGGQLGLFDPA